MCLKHLAHILRRRFPERSKASEAKHFMNVMRRKPIKNILKNNPYKKNQMLQLNTWHRQYLRSEWKRRQEARRARTRVEGYRSRCKALERELANAHHQLRSQELTISAQKNVLDTYKLPAYASFRLCKAKSHEICPLSTSQIRTSFLPYAPATVYDPARPRLTCIELGCGHRFSAMWIVNHFVRRSTFQCPVCSVGPSRFRFQADDLPSHLQNVFWPASE